MFITIGFIVGFIAGWWVNEKVENLGEKINPLKWIIAGRGVVPWRNGAPH